MPPHQECGRTRHLPTVGMVIFSFSATCVLVTPEAHCKTIRDRRAKRCDVFGLRDHCSSLICSSLDKTSSFKGRPVLMAFLQLNLMSYLETQLEEYLLNEFMTQDTSVPSIFD